MKTKASKIKTDVICVAVLLTVAAASFISMNYFDRHVFDNCLPFQISFGLLAVLMLAVVFIHSTMLTLLLLIASAVGMWFFTPAFTVLFFPIGLQAVLYDAAKNKQKGSGAVCFIALFLNAAALVLWFQSKKTDEYRLPSYSNDQTQPETILFLVLFSVLILFYAYLFVRRLRSNKKRTVPYRNDPQKNERRTHRSAQKKQARKPAKKKNAAATARDVPIFLICAVNTAAQMAYGILFLHTEYCKVLFFTQMLFLLFLEYRQEPLLRLHTAVGSLLDSALGDSMESESLYK